MSTEHQVESDSNTPSWLRRTGNWLNRHKYKLAIGAMAVSSTAIVVTGAAKEAVEQAKEVAPEVGVGLVVAESLWIGGAAMMGAAVGKKEKNPFKIHKRFKEIAADANNSTLFKSGLTINTVGAVSEFVIPTVAVVTQLPPESWGVLTPVTVDFAMTLLGRHAIVQGMKTYGNQTSEGQMGSTMTDTESLALPESLPLPMTAEPGSSAV